MQNWKKPQKEKKTLFVNTIVLTTFVKMSVIFFSAFLIFAVFGISMFFRDVFWQVSKIQKITKYEINKTKTQQPENKMQSKKKWNVMIENNTRQQAEKQKQKNILKQKSKHNKKKKQEPERENEKQEGRKKENNKRETKKEKWKKGGGPKKAKEKQRETLKINKKCLF